MSRNLWMFGWVEGHRRSPRISALDSYKAQKTRQDSVGGGGLRGGSCKRKLQAMEDIEDESDDQPSQEANSSDSGQHSVVPPETSLPKKHVLELVLDTLQRRDTYEIFAEPVDPNEVEDYHEIIEEPMDFGTMRAKLHEGLYQTFQQFEHDAFLITKNAMHFNSSNTIYFKQARAIHEQTKKVFHLLKTDPEEFEQQFSDTRRRSTRKLTRTENRKAQFSTKSFRKTTSNKRSGGATEHEVLKTTLFSSPTPSRSVQIGSSFGEASNGRKQSIVDDRRSTYRPWKSSSIFTAMSSDLQPLTLVNQQGIGYAESLMKFAKNLGPVAQKVAQRKLLGVGMPSDDQNPGRPTAQLCSLTPKSRAQEVLQSSTWLGSRGKSDTMQVTLKPQTVWDRPKRRPVVLGCTSPRLYSGLIDARKKANSTDQRSSLSRNFAPVTLNIGQNSNQMHSSAIHEDERAKEQSDSYTHKPKNQMSDSLDSRTEKSALNLSNMWVQRTMPNHLQNMSLVKGQNDSVHSSLSRLAPLPSSQFKFDLPYLKTKLEQMKPVEPEKLVYTSGPSNLTDPLPNKNIYQSFIDDGENCNHYSEKQPISIDDWLLL